ncbi:MAG: glycoside hydrolase family 38 C-terminal domain-containing protein [Anaerolineaceae bacterium]|nr:glycoside hydrolase family 38 C-terminal domain-containing protein [Anaerolineaceae bacterium]
MKTLHIISHTHWDREWYRTFQEFRLRLVHLIDRLLVILEQDAEFRYYMLDGQTIVLDDYLAIRPDRFDLLKKHIQSGRILVGPWHVLPDEFLVSPEAIIRNLIQGAATCARFGPRMMIGYTPDPFGHISQLPQILCGFGIEDACLQRGLSDEPTELWWQSPDGSNVFLAYQREGYGNAANLPVKDTARALAEVTTLRDTLAAYSASAHLLIMHGTDHMEPVEETADLIQYLNHHLDGDQVVHSTLPKYIQAARQSVNVSGLKLPTVYGELRSSKRSPLLPNVLSTRIWIKQRNASCQQLLEKWAEPFSTFAEQVVHQVPNGSQNSTYTWIHRLDHPEQILKVAWRLLLECQPHDSICGCSIDQVHDEMRSRFDQVEQIGEGIVEQSLLALAESIHTLTANHPKALAAVTVFNPSPFPRTDVTCLPIQIPADVDSFDVVDASGDPLQSWVCSAGKTEIATLLLNHNEVFAMKNLFQSGSFGGAVVWDVTMQPKGNTLWVEILMKSAGTPNVPVLERAISAAEAYLQDATLTQYHVHVYTIDTVELHFSPKDVPGIGYKTFWIYPAEQLDRSRVMLPSGSSIENDDYLIEVNPVDGSFSVLDKRSGARFTGLNRFSDGGDRGDEYNYNPPENDLRIAGSLKNITIDDHVGFLTLTIDLDLNVPESLSDDRQSRSTEMISIPVRTQVSLSPGVHRIDVHTEVENTACDHRLQVHFPLPFSAAYADYDGHFDVIHRPVELPLADPNWIERPRPEQPQREFVDVHDSEIGLMIANRGLPEAAVTRSSNGNSEIVLTLLRSVGWLSRGDLTERKNDAGPSMPTPGAQLLGKLTFDYAIIPHTGDWSQVWPQAVAFNAPLRAVATTLHEGILPPEGAIISVQPDCIDISTIKAAEDGTGWIVRGYNRSSEPVEARLLIARPYQQANRARLDETELGPINAYTDGSLAIPLRGNEIFTIRFH